MKKSINNKSLYIILPIISILTFGVHYQFFKDYNFIFLYVLYDLAFLPIQVLLVTLVFNKVLEDNEKAKTMKKLNMVIGVFFSEVGNQLAHLFIECEKDMCEIKNILCIENQWTEKDLKVALNKVKDYEYKTIIEPNDMLNLSSFMSDKREFMLKIIENPILLEHELFADLLMTLFHLQEELSARENLSTIDRKDKEHIRVDLARAERLLLMQWVLYMQHLKSEYPYLYSFNIRTNPFNDNAVVEIK